jgi:site-specific DNA-adenine methylase
MNLKPIVKWTGGKRQTMKQITRYFPENYGNYYEPFAGGLSVFMELHNNGKLDGKQCCCWRWRGCWEVLDLVLAQRIACLAS